MTRVRWRSTIAALSLAACAAHGPTPTAHAPEDPPPLAEWDGPSIPEALVKAAERAVTASAYASGKREAYRAIDRGELALHTSSLPAECRQRYGKLLWRKHRIEHRPPADRVVDEALRDRLDGFNAVMKAEIERRFGTDALAAAARQAGCR
ncbi:hypothetical protein [Nannocystis sp. SCPEA4]|uniref:hypothetical protein n=1 Tax=Nannocystis sp. SCPEA4 TaxID=2996787 RepID=UPI00226E5095|nr:hypothetical protein [Nannocystis sp. SCPEA4]MCY1057293.1 hypothetical protein [Nannocystis sp. SCPEA4]